ncbi:MAG: transglutaminase family protein [Vulcanimicrobiota bacterium]
MHRFISHNRIILLLIMLLLFPTSAESAVFAEPAAVYEGNYVIMYGSQVAGNSHYKVEEEAAGNSVRISTDTKLQALMRKNMVTDFIQKLTVTMDGKTGEVKEYTIANNSPFKAERTAIKASGGTVEVSRTTDSTTVTRALPYKSLPLPVDIHCPARGNLNIPLLSYLMEREGIFKKDGGELQSFSTTAFSTVPLKVTREKTDGRESVFVIEEVTEGSRVSHRITVSCDTGKITRIDSPFESTSYILGAERKISTPPEIFAAYRITLPCDLKNCATLKTKVKVQIVQEDITSEKLCRSFQTFSGTCMEGVIDGTLETRSVNQKLISSDAYPCQYSGEGLEKFMKSDFFIESDDNVIKKEAEALVKDRKSVKEAALSLAKWIYENIKFEYTDGSAKATLICRKGDWLPRNRLYIAMLRSLGIPARYAGGLFITENLAGNYLWTEVYMGKEAGWIPVDTALGQIEYFSANHVTFWNYGAVEPYTLKPVVEVMEHQEEPMPKGSKFMIR